MVAAAPTRAAFPGNNGPIAFVSDRDSTTTLNDEIYLINADGTGTPTNLTSNQTSDVFPDWGPAPTKKSR